jgi:excisionase family DNA binding protein
MSETSWLDVPPSHDVANRKAIRFEERPTCTVKEACAAVGLGKTKIHELIGGGAVESVKVGRRRLVNVPSLLRYLSAPPVRIR